MTRSEFDLIRRALQLLHELVPDDESRAVYPAPRRCPVILFAKRYLVRQPGADMTCAELWQFHREVVAAGELEPLAKQEFLRALPGAMSSVFGVNKCHTIRRDRHTVRGFRGVGVRMDDGLPTALQTPPEHPNTVT